MPIDKKLGISLSSVSCFEDQKFCSGPTKMGGGRRRSGHLCSQFGNDVQQSRRLDEEWGHFIGDAALLCSCSAVCCWRPL